MTQVFTAEGLVEPVTVLQLGPCPVLQIRYPSAKDGNRDVRKDGYSAVQLGFKDKPRKAATRPEQGHVAANLKSKRKEARQKDDAEKLKEMVDKLVVTVRRKVGEQNALYGSVTNADVAEELEKIGYQIEKRKIHMDDHIKQLGEFEIPVRLFKDVTAHVKLKVEPELEA